MGFEWVVGRVDSKHPPWSTEMSTSTEPDRICACQYGEADVDFTRQPAYLYSDHVLRTRKLPYGLLDIL